MKGPTIGISCDVLGDLGARRYAQSTLDYARSVHAAGGVPLLLAPIEEAVSEQLAACSGVVLIGGGDPRTERYGAPSHPLAKLVSEARQRYDESLIELLLARPELPCLAICLGMQMLVLGAGGSLLQHLPDVVPGAERHAGREHDIVVEAGSRFVAGAVFSSHHQAVDDPGRFRVSARCAADGVIEAVELPSHRFCVGVQWHPERTADARLGHGLFVQLAAAARECGRAANPC